MNETEFKATLQMLIPMIIEKMEESYQLILNYILIWNGKQQNCGI